MSKIDSKPIENSILKVENLWIGYESSSTSIQTIAKDINFEIKTPQLVGIVGANGIGKSTLLRSLSGMQPKIEGEIYLQGNKLQSLDYLERSKLMSLVLTEQTISKNLSVVELISLGRQPYTNWYGKLEPKDIEVINTAISLTGLEKIRTKKCAELSDGQLQKVMIARAFAQETDLILMDEPTTHLDLYHKAYIMKMMKEMVKNSNKTILFSSHEIDLAIQLCDHMIVMTDNQVYFDEPCKLIEAGVFEGLFPKDLISFDSNSGTFKLYQKN
ncbi:iron complex transport system ATP-binding protein [Flavobacteriaceae bacterium MAR_2010_188]|nr:iron complex transport system ATP-binding protein [Flavobacteriaceae bacterium MAR_2010_188]